MLSLWWQISFNIAVKFELDSRSLLSHFLHGSYKRNVTHPHPKFEEILALSRHSHDLFCFLMIPLDS